LRKIEITLTIGLPCTLHHPLKMAGSHQHCPICIAV
jgi:hypothetical protein